MIKKIIFFLIIILFLFFDFSSIKDNSYSNTVKNFFNKTKEDITNNINDLKNTEKFPGKEKISSVRNIFKKATRTYKTIILDTSVVITFYKENIKSAKEEFKKIKTGVWKIKEYIDNLTNLIQKSKDINSPLT